MQSISTLLRTIREDLTAHRGEWSRPGFQTVAVHRFGVWTKSLQTRVVRRPFVLLAKTANVFCRNFYGIELPFEAYVGRRVVIEHQGGIVVHGNTIIGDDCTIRQGCTLGCKDIREAHLAPMLGNGVELGAGAKILGNVQIGSFATIGANAVVVKDVPQGAVAVGVPARVVK